MKKPKVVILDEHGGFSIVIDGKRFHFYDEDPVRDLTKVFEELGCEATYEEVC